jgi:hypothetical protein
VAFPIGPPTLEGLATEIQRQMTSGSSLFAGFSGARSAHSSGFTEFARARRGHQDRLESATRRRRTKVPPPPHPHPTRTHAHTHTHTHLHCPAALRSLDRHSHVSCLTVHPFASTVHIAPLRNLLTCVSTTRPITYSPRPTYFFGGFQCGALATSPRLRL